MIDALVDATKFIVEQGVEKWRKSKERQNLKLCVRDQIRREMRFNLEVLDELLRKGDDEVPQWKGESRLRLIQALRTIAYDSLDGHLVPLSELLDGSLDPKTVFRVKEGAREPPTHFSKVKGLKTEAELLERTYHRLRLYGTYGEEGGRKPNLDYLRLLVEGMIESLKKDAGK